MRSTTTIGNKSTTSRIASSAGCQGDWHCKLDHNHLESQKAFGDHPVKNLQSTNDSEVEYESLEDLDLNLDLALEFEEKDYESYLEKLQSRKQDSCTCVELTTHETNALYSNNKVVQQFTHLFQFPGYKLSRVCGLSCESSFCVCGCLGANYPEHIMLAQVGSTNGGVTEETRYGLVNQFFMPKSIPYCVENSSVYGEVFITPFYSVIPALVTRIPDKMFRMTRISYYKAISTAQFRHELAFNPTLSIEVPQDTIDACNDMGFWLTVASELGSLRISNLARAPLSTLPTLFCSLKDLLLTTIQPYLAIQMDSVFNLQAMLEDPYDVSMGTLSTFLQSCLKCMKHTKVNTLSELTKEHLRNPHNVPAFILGIRNVILIASLYKAATINDNLEKVRLALILSLSRYENEYFNDQIIEGSMFASDFDSWAKQAKAPAELLPQSPSTSSSELTFDQFVVKFMACFFPQSERQDIPVIFDLDKSRIERLQSEFDIIVLNKFVEVLKKSQSEQNITKLLGSANLAQLSLYKLIETRTIKDICNLLDLHQEAKLKPEQSNLDSIAHELALLLSIHWHASNNYYDSK